MLATVDLIAVASAGMPALVESKRSVRVSVACVLKCKYKLHANLCVRDFCRKANCMPAYVYVTFVGRNMYTMYTYKGCLDVYWSALLSIMKIDVFYQRNDRLISSVSDNVCPKQGKNCVSG